MIETIPNYIIDLNKKLDLKFDKIDNQFKEIKGEIVGIKGEIIEMKEDINDIAINTAQNLRDIAEIKDEMKGMATKEDIKDMATKEDIREMATKSDVKSILQLVGSYEVRSINIENILLQDHKPRISALEKEVF